MLLLLARCGVTALTVFFAIWVIAELKHREEISKVVGLEAGVGQVSNFSFGWRLPLVFLSGLPVLTILWTLVT